MKYIIYKSNDKNYLLYLHCKDHKLNKFNFVAKSLFKLENILSFNNSIYFKFTFNSIDDFFENIIEETRKEIDYDVSCISELSIDEIKDIYIMKDIIK